MAIRSKKYKTGAQEQPPSDGAAASLAALHARHARPQPPKSWRRVPWLGWCSFILALCLLATAAGSVIGMWILAQSENITLSQVYADSSAARLSDTYAYQGDVARRLENLLRTGARRVYNNSQLYADYQDAENQGLFSSIGADSGESGAPEENPAEYLQRAKEEIARAHNILLPDQAAQKNYLQEDGTPLGTDASGGLVACGTKDSSSGKLLYFDFSVNDFYSVDAQRDYLYRIADDGKTFNENTKDSLRQGALPDGFSLWLQATMAADRSITVEGLHDGAPLSNEQKNFYEQKLNGGSQGGYSLAGEAELDNRTRVVTLAVREEPLPFGYLQNATQYYTLGVDGARAGLFCAALGVLFLILTVIFAPGKVAADRFWARVTGAVALEIKIPLLIVFCALPAISVSMWQAGMLSGLWAGIATAATVCYYYILIAYFLINDLWNFTFDKYSFIRNAYVRGQRRREETLNRTPLQRRLLREFRPTAAAIGAFTVFMGIVLIAAFPQGFPVWIPLVVATLFLLRKHAKHLDFVGAQMTKITYQLGAIRRGEMPAPLHVEGGADLSQAGDNLNALQEGIEYAVNERMKSERMKVELVTNVSHDLKTPLTSIISYVDLLQQEDLPPAARDYVQILAQKSSRLKAMVLDVFEVSKAATGNLPIQPKALDLGKLLRQTLADMDAQIAQAPVEVRTQLPESPVWVYTDGDRMYRVFQNLIQNALQYSLEHSRIYVRLMVDGDGAVATVRNTSKYEIGDVDALMERFVRGDKNRSTSGSGLGLSIAQTFTQACGGAFRIFSQADLFTAVVTMPLTTEIPEDAGVPGPAVPAGHWEGIRGASAGGRPADAQMPGMEPAQSGAPEENN